MARKNGYSGKSGLKTSFVDISFFLSPTIHRGGSPRTVGRTKRPVGRKTKRESVHPTQCETITYLDVVVVVLIVVLIVVFCHYFDCCCWRYLLNGCSVVYSSVILGNQVVYLLS